MTAEPCAMPTGYGRTCPLPGDHDGGCQPEPTRSRKPITPQRCGCGRPVPASSSCGCHCAEHDLTASTARPFRTDGGPSLREYLESKGEL